MQTESNSEPTERILVVAPFGNDSEVLAGVLARNQLSAQICRTIPDACIGLMDAAVLLLAEEAVNRTSAERLIETLGNEPPWSQLPIVIFTAHAEAARRTGTFQLLSSRANVSLLERPFRIVTLLSVVRAALVSRRRQYEVRDLLRQREAQLKEKEVLLKEIHHRVKNNLQVICSLLNLQLRNADPVSRALVQESQNRIRNMALIHEKLYQTENFSQLDFCSYIHELAAALSRTYGPENKKIEMKIECENLFVELDKAIPTGLLVNEILSNVFKHAFPDRDSGQVFLKFCRQEGRYFLEVSDDGVGIPTDIEIERGKTLGLNLVRMLVRQLNGTVELDRSAGTRYQIHFE